MRTANSLSLPLAGIFPPVQQAEEGDALHQTGGRVSEEPAPRLERPVDADVVVRRHVEVARLGRVVRGLLGDVVGPVLVLEVPVAGEDLAEDRVQRLLDAPSEWLAVGFACLARRARKLVY